MKILKRYRSSIICLIILIIMYLVNREIGRVAIEGTIENIWELVKLVPPVFVLLGLMDVWVPKEKMIKYMGDGSNFIGILLAFIMGAFAAGPLYAAFPIGAMLLIEVSSLGAKFTIIRLVVEIIGIVLVAEIISRVINDEDRNLIYENAKKL